MACSKNGAMQGSVMVHRPRVLMKVCIMGLHGALERRRGCRCTKAGHPGPAMKSPSKV